MRPCQLIESQEQLSLQAGRANTLSKGVAVHPVPLALCVSRLEESGGDARQSVAHPRAHLELRERVRACVTHLAERERRWGRQRE
jgi:hypothetical protein